MPGKQTIICIGTNHKKAPIELRENLFIDSEQIALHLEHLQKEFRLTELAILSTCNRLEILGSIDESTIDHDYLVSIFMRLQELCGNADLLKSVEVRSSLYALSGFAAYIHVLRVAASLDSLVIGETQITGQFKDAIRLAQDQGRLGGILERLSQDALATAKKVRSQTEIGKKSVSIASAAVELINTVFSEIDRHQVMIVGAGEMARVVAQHLIKANPKSLAVVNRSEAKALELIKELGRGDYIALDSLTDELEKFDIIVTATASSQYLIRKDDFINFKSSTKMRLCVDISLPRNIDPACSELNDLFTFDIDDLKQIVDSHSRMRSEAAADAEIIVQNSAERFNKWVNSQGLNPILKDNQNFFTAIVEHEFNRAKTDWGDKSQIVENLKQSLIKQLTATINRNLQSYDQRSPHQLDYELLQQTFTFKKKADDET